MKATKLIAVALILGIASLGFAQSDSHLDKAPNDNAASICIKLRQAMQSPELVKAMRVQLNPDFLKVDKKIYTVPVRIKRTVLYVAGTHGEWMNFFRIRPDDPPVAKNALIHIKAALKDKNLAQAMRSQLSKELLNADKELYVAPVRYKHSIVYVAGSYNDWKAFFSIRPKTAPQG